MKLAQWLALAKLARHALKLGLHHFINVQALPSGGVQRLMAVLQKIFAAPSDDQAKRLCVLGGVLRWPLPWQRLVLDQGG